MRVLMIGLEIAGKLLLAAFMAVVGLLALAVPSVALIWGLSPNGWQTPLREVMTLPFMGTLMQFVQGAAFIGAALAMYALFERKRGWRLGWWQYDGSAFRQGCEGLLWGMGLMSLSFLVIWATGGLRIEGAVFHSEIARDLGVCRDASL